MVVKTPSLRHQQVPRMLALCCAYHAGVRRVGSLGQPAYNSSNPSHEVGASGLFSAQRPASEYDRASGLWRTISEGTPALRPCSVRVLSWGHCSVCLRIDVSFTGPRLSPWVDGVATWCVCGQTLLTWPSFLVYWHLLPSAYQAPCGVDKHWFSLCVEFRCLVFVHLFISVANNAVMSILVFASLPSSTGVSWSIFFEIHPINRKARKL